MHDPGVGTARNMHSVISGIFLPSLNCRAESPTVFGAGWNMDW